VNSLGIGGFGGATILGGGGRMMPFCPPLGMTMAVGWFMFSLLS